MDTTPGTHRSVAHAVLACVLAVGGGAGCGIFKSSTSQASAESSSKFSSSPFESSSKSSGDEASPLARDVRVYSASLARAGGDAATLRRDVGSIAEAYGVFDWEGDATVHRAMGRGFHEAGLDPDRARRLGAAVTARDETRLRWVLAGYGSAAPE
jgi:hypothetical protein